MTDETISCRSCGLTYPAIHPAELSLIDGVVGPFCDGCFYPHPLIAALHGEDPFEVVRAIHEDREEP